MVQYLTCENWQSLYKKYPNLAGEMAEMSIRNELVSLKKQLTFERLDIRREKWILERIEHLETHS